MVEWVLQVDCSSAKASILQQATALRQALQRQIAVAWTDSNKAVSARSASASLCCSNFYLDLLKINS